MKFKIKTAAHFTHESEEDIFKEIGLDIKNPDLFVEIEVDTLEDFCKLVEKIGPIVMSVTGPENLITIYNDYLE